MRHSDVFLQRVDVSKHVWAVVTVERRNIGELQQGESRRRRRAHVSSTAAVSFAHVFVEVVERRQGVQAEVTRMALLRFICVDGLQMDLQHRQAVEVSLRTVRARVRDFTPVPSSTCSDRQTNFYVKNTTSF